MSRRITLWRDESGAASIEMALAVPVLAVFLWGIFQVGIAFQAVAGMNHALGEGARYATLCATITATGCSAPTDANIKTRMSSKLFGRGSGQFTVQDPVNGTGFKTLRITYTVPMNFLFFPGPTVTLNRSKKAYVVI